MQRHGTLVTVTTTEAESGDLEDVEVDTAVMYELQQQQRSEQGDQTTWQVGVWNLFLPPTTAVAGADRFIDDTGAKYDFEGPPWLVHNPRTGRKSHVQATVRSVS